MTKDDMMMFGKIIRAILDDMMMFGKIIRPILADDMMMSGKIIRAILAGDMMMFGKIIRTILDDVWADDMMMFGKIIRAILALARDVSETRGVSLTNETIGYLEEMQDALAAYRTSERKEAE